LFVVSKIVFIAKAKKSPKQKTRKKENNKQKIPRLRALAGSQIPVAVRLRSL